jgi:hypothetical protein
MSVVFLLLADVFGRASDYSAYCGIFNVSPSFMADMCA